MASSRYSVLATRLEDVGAHIGAAVRGVLPVMRGAAADLCVFAGVAAIAYAFGLVWRPALFFFLGIVLVIFGVRGIQPPPAGGAAE